MAEEFIKPLMAVTGLSRERVVVIPGNHDVVRDAIEPVTEKGLRAMCSVQEINAYIRRYRLQPESYAKAPWNDGIKRIQRYKEFEQRFYEDISLPDYYLSNFESCFVYEIDHLKIGVAAFNSAWRCSSDLPGDKLFLGTQQILDAAQFFQVKGTTFNIALVHHPVEFFSDIERPEIKGFLSSKNFPVILCGHTHSTDSYHTLGPMGDSFISVAKSAFSNPREAVDAYKPGFTVFDIGVNGSGEIEIDGHFRKYVHLRTDFDFDVEASKGGILKSRIRPSQLLTLAATKVPSQIMREGIVIAWESVTQTLIESAFPDIGRRMGELIKAYMLPDKLDHYFKDLHISFEIKPEDANHFRLVETQDFFIISDSQPFVYDSYYYVEKSTDKTDKTDILITKMEIDGVEYKDNQAFLSAKELMTEDKKSVQKAIIFKKLMNEGKKSYHVKRVTESVHSLKLNGIWKFDVRGITEKLTLQTRVAGNYEVDVVKFGNSSPNFKEFKPFADTDGQIYEDLVMPGEGFILVVKSKD